MMKLWLLAKWKYIVAGVMAIMALIVGSRSKKQKNDVAPGRLSEQAAIRVAIAVKAAQARQKAETDLRDSVEEVERTSDAALDADVLGRHGGSAGD